MNKWILCLLFFVAPVFAQPPVTKVIELHYLTADKVIELMKPFMEPGEQMSGQGQMLVLKVNPKTLSDIRSVLHQIDVPPITFKVSIHQGDSNVMAPLNQWVALGNTNGHDSEDTSTVYSSKPAFIKNTTLYIKVSVVKP